MKKITSIIGVILTLALIGASCSGDSYEKKLKKERKAINDFLADNNIEVLHTYPENHKFGENQFYLEGSTGVYVRVLSAGNMDVAALKTNENIEVTMRFDSVLSMVQDVYSFGNNFSTGLPINFIYGKNITYVDNTSNSIKTSYMSPACVLPLEKGLRTGAEVSLIVPFVNGSAYQASNYEPFYYPYVTYTYYRQEE